MNTTVDPCTDFYQYACGTWNAGHPLPADRSRYGRFNELQDHNERISLDILQGAAAKQDRAGLEQTIGDFYASCMNTDAIAKKGLEARNPTPGIRIALSPASGPADCRCPTAITISKPMRSPSKLASITCST